MTSAYSTATPPLFDSSPSPQPPPHHPMSRSFTIPTPESSPSSCTSDVFHHSAFQPTTGLHSPMSEVRTIATYTLPTPEVSPLEPTPRPLDYQTYGSLAPHPDRFSFDGGSLSGEFQSNQVCLCLPQQLYNNNLSQLGKLTRRLS